MSRLAFLLAFGTNMALAQGNLVPMPGGPGSIMAARQPSAELDALRDCTRANRETLSLIRAAEELARTVNNIRITGAKGANAYQQEQLERQWKYYKSLGGTAASPEQVRVPEDPCRQQKEAFQRRAATAEAEYQQCVAAHPREMKLFALSADLARNRAFLAAYEKMPPEKAAEFRVDPAQVRAALAVKFQEYRSAGGTASRLEDVTEIPNPCLPTIAAPAKPSPITERRSLQIR